MTLRSFSWKGWLAFVGFAAALSVWTWSGALFKDHTLEQHVSYFLELFQRSLLNYLPAYLLVGIVDGLALRGARRRFALGAALVAGILLAVQVRCAVNANQMFYAYESVQLPYCTTFPTWRTYIDFAASWITPLTIAGVVMIFVFARRRDAELVESLRRAQSREIETRRQRVESDIAAMQARVDPDKLLDTLRGIRARYEEGLADGEAMLDALIGELREAARGPTIAEAAE